MKLLMAGCTLSFAQPVVFLQTRTMHNKLGFVIMIVPACLQTARAQVVINEAGTSNASETAKLVKQ
jgi:hypothetical protein